MTVALREELPKNIEVALICPGLVRSELAKETQEGMDTDAYAALVAAESSRAAGRHDLAGWDAAHAAWDRLGQPYPAAYALLHAAREVAGSRAGWGPGRPEPVPDDDSANW